MKLNRSLFAAGFLAATALATPALAETVLRADFSPVGEIDPAKASDYADSVLMYNLYDTLVIPNEGKPGYQPLLADSWSANDDATVYTFKLRDDVSFQDGTPMTAEDVVFSMDRMKALGQGLSYLFEVVDSVEAAGDHTVVFTLNEPYAPFVSSLVRLPVVNKALVLEHIEDGDGENEMGDWGQAWLSGHTAGTGAYSLVSHNPQSETDLAKNSDYFLGVPDAAPDTVRMRYGLEPATVRTLIAQGEHDISSQWMPPEVLKSLANDGAQLLTESGTTEFYIKMNTAEPPFDDEECRKAVSYAFDYDTGVKMVSITDKVSQGSPSTGALPVGMMGALGEDHVIRQDLDKAKEHLANCSYADDMNIEISWIGEVPLEERFALLMQANLAQIGVQSTIRKVPWALFTEQVSKPENTPDISQVFVNTVTGDPDTLLYSMYHSSSAGTWMSPEHLNDPKVDELLDAGRKESDPARRAEIYKELNTYLVSIAPSIFAQDQTAVFAASDRVSAPTLSDPSKAYALAGFGFNFRMMEMKDAE
ncbi:ABC transporter substrate-binding protein [Martelella mediterranea]|uniref:Peptide/nickel transport system substrate-binding protein n=1 Tax=Martelella mediterranea TaxID=293089 RepID=A0A4R3NUQ0_9HYPH|nr:ABC transporter substrate-binding protein [Martelella mediterranea]TCT39862.1 peptide/nickel transport system substrate-binding protein [Martelella mediterranea]